MSQKRRHGTGRRLPVYQATEPLRADDSQMKSPGQKATGAKSLP
jgi:hypothetical protein